MIIPVERIAERQADSPPVGGGKKEWMMWTVLALLGIAVLCFFAVRLARPEYMTPRCCMGLALRIIKDYDEKQKQCRANGSTSLQGGEEGENDTAGRA